MPYNSLIFDMPMDELPNSPIAYDFGPQQTHAKVSGNTFVPGQFGRAMRSNGSGIAKTRNTQIPISADFSVTFWARNRTIQGVAAPQGIEFQFEIAEASVVSFQHNNPDVDNWVFWAVVKTNAGAKFYKNGTEIGTLAFSGSSLSGWAFRQILPDADDASFDYDFDIEFGNILPGGGIADLDEVMIFDKALTLEEINQLMDPSDSQILYWIDDNKFLDFGVYVEQSKGLIDALKTKEITKVDWAGGHGVIADLERPRFMPREITLECFFKSNGYNDFVYRQNEFLSYFKTKGTHRLKVEIDRRRPLVYEVYMEDATDIVKKWRNGEFIGKFNLKLVEYLPVKRVLRFTRHLENSTLKINLNTLTPFNVYWGDGTVTENVLGQHLLQHSYQDAKAYQIIIAGVLEDITTFTHNGILLWNSL